MPQLLPWIMALGRILDFLREKGELEKTLIFFMADNGMNMGHHGIWGKETGPSPSICMIPP